MAECINGDGGWAPSESGCCWQCSTKTVAEWVEYIREQKKPKPRGKKKKDVSNK